MGSGSSKAAAERAAAKKGSDRHLWQAAYDNNEPELKRLIGLGWNVNWHNPEVRRRMCFAWALASSPPLLLRSPSPPTRRRPTRRQISPQLAARSAAALAVPPPRRPAELCTRVLVARRAPHPRVLVHAPRVMALGDSSSAHLPSTDPQL